MTAARSLQGVKGAGAKKSALGRQQQGEGNDRGEVYPLEHCWIQLCA